MNKEYKELESNYWDLIVENEKLEKELKIKHDGFMASTKELCECSEKIDKAINFIKEHAYYEDEIFLCDKEVINLLEILKGGNE